MNTLQFFHKKEELPMFNIGDKVRLKDSFVNLFPLHHDLNSEKLRQVHKNIEEKVGLGNHQVSKIEPGTPEAGGWFVWVDGKNEWFNGYHGNLFELV